MKLKRYVVVEFGRVIGVGYSYRPLDATWIESETANIGSVVTGFSDASTVQASTDGGSGGGPVEPPGP